MSACSVMLSPAEAMHNPPPSTEMMLRLLRHSSNGTRLNMKRTLYSCFAESVIPVKKSPMHQYVSFAIYSRSVPSSEELSWCIHAATGLLTGPWLSSYNPELAAVKQYAQNALHLQKLSQATDSAGE